MMKKEATEFLIIFCYIFTFKSVIMFFFVLSLLKEELKEEYFENLKQRLNALENYLSEKPWFAGHNVG